MIRAAAGRSDKAGIALVESERPDAGIRLALAGPLVVVDDALQSDTPVEPAASASAITNRAEPRCANVPGRNNAREETVGG